MCVCVCILKAEARLIIASDVQVGTGQKVRWTRRRLFLCPSRSGIAGSFIWCHCYAKVDPKDHVGQQMEVEQLLVEIF